MNCFPLYLLNGYFFFLILLAYIHCTRGDSLRQSQIALHYTLVRSLPPAPPSTTSLPHLKQLQEVPSFYFIYVYKAHQPYSLTFISSIHLPPPTSIPPTIPILWTCLWFLISKSTFKGVSWCIPAVSVPYIDQFNLFCYSPSHSPLFNSCQNISLYLLPAQM
jgi:hypothetical protein